MYDGNCVTVISADNLDDLIVKGIRHILEKGERFTAAAGTGHVAYSMNYVLADSRQRILNIRNPQALQYLCRELIAYFKGSLNIRDGLLQASSYWKNMTDETGQITSNYGYYVFHERPHGETQYEWVLSHLVKNQQTRQALISINQTHHKNRKVRDFPCTIALQFLVRDGSVCCEVMSRSCDIIFGLPYDLGFFSFLTELVCVDLNERTSSNLVVGYTMLRCTFSQIYDKTADKAAEVLRISSDKKVAVVRMPFIEEPRVVLGDIYQGTRVSRVIDWIHEYAAFKKDRSSI